MCGDYGSHIGDGRRLKQRLQRYIDLELLDNAGDNPSGRQRVTTQVEEIIVDANRADTKDFFPNPHEVFFHLILWMSVRRA